MSSPTSHLRARLLAILAIAIGVAILAGAVYAVTHWKKSVTLRLSAGQPGGTYLPFAHDVAKLIEQKNPQIKVEVLESDGSSENSRRVTSGEAELALIQNDIPSTNEIRAIGPLYSGALHIIVRRDSKIRTLSDLRNHKVGYGKARSGTPQIVHALLDHYELKKEIKLVSLEIEDCFSMLKQREIDALMIMLGVGSPAMESAADDGDVRLIPIGSSIDQGSELESFQLHYPFAESILIPRFAYAVPNNQRPGVPERGIPAVSVRTVLATHSKVPSHVIEKITKTLHENRAALIREYPPAAEISESFDRGSLQFPLHVGAARYLQRNEPGFLVKYAEVMGLSLSLLIAAIGLLATLKSWFHQKQKDRIDDYYLQLDAILERLEPNDLDQDALFEIHEELRSLRRCAVRQLSQEKLLPDESFRIFQGLLSDCQNRVRRMQEN